MSTSYAPLKDIRAAELFDGRLEKYGIKEYLTSEATKRHRCLTDGLDYLWVLIDEEGGVIDFTRYGLNDSSEILIAIADTFNTYLASEYEPEYQGFDTEEE
jgi:hypothetical protein